MACLALLLAGSHEVKCTGCQSLVHGLGLRHCAVCIVLGCLLVPVAHVAGVVYLIEGHQRQVIPLIGADVFAAGIDTEAQVLRAQALYATEHILTAAYEQRCRRQVLRRSAAAWCMVHTSLTAIFVLQLLIDQSCSLGFFG